MTLPLRVLIVDDSETVVAALSETLSSSLSNAEVLTCNSVDSAIALLRTEDPSVVIADFHLGDRKGDEVFQYVSSLKLDILCIGISAENTEEIRNTFEEAGASLFVAKDSLSDLNHLIPAELERKGFGDFGMRGI